MSHHRQLLTAVLVLALLAPNLSLAQPDGLQPEGATSQAETLPDDTDYPPPDWTYGPATRGAAVLSLGLFTVARLVQLAGTGFHFSVVDPGYVNLPGLRVRFNEPLDPLTVVPWETATKYGINVQLWLVGTTDRDPAVGGPRPVRITRPFLVQSLEQTEIIIVPANEDETGRQVGGVPQGDAEQEHGEGQAYHQGGDVVGGEIEVFG